ncbi:MAG: hypothetical protein K8I03_14720 [Ignavibacteria bacterium]|nr:hypothetical protein [Ignavibacteria bacterium]
MAKLPDISEMEDGTIVLKTAGDDFEVFKLEAGKWVSFPDINLGFLLKSRPLSASEIDALVFDGTLPH